MNAPRKVVIAYWEREQFRLIIVHTGLRSRSRVRAMYERSNADIHIVNIWGGTE